MYFFENFLIYETPYFISVSIDLLNYLERILKKSDEMLVFID